MRSHLLRSTLFSMLLAAAASCGDDGNKPGPDAPTTNPDAPAETLQSKVKTIVVIYAENRSFDNIYDKFPGANGIPGVNPTATGTYKPQLDRDGTTLATLPQAWTGVTAAGITPVITQAQSAGLANTPYSLETTYAAGGFGLPTITRDLYHRFFENQMQIDGGKNDQFAGIADSGGLVMGYYDGAPMALWHLAQQNVLADNFFTAAFGGSFLNHQYLICACAPEYPNADTDPAVPTIATVDMSGASFTNHLTINTATSPASALDGPPVFTLSGNIVPKNYFGDGKFYAVNTMQPPYQPSTNAPAATDTTMLYADRTKPTTLPPQTAATIGDQLDGKSVTWKWYSGAWNATLALATSTHALPANTPGSAPNFQYHHQPFNYYSKFDPVTGTAARTEHLKDYTDLLADITAGTLPEVVFYKPEGDLNQHGGYTSVSAGDAHIADLVAKLQASPQYENMVIVITYDENGGFWDHVAPPKGDLLGPGTRIPAIIVSPFAKTGTIDHTPYDTGSIQRLIAHRFGLTDLPGITARDQALVANGGVAMGDLTNALDFTK